MLILGGRKIGEPRQKPSVRGVGDTKSESDGW